MVWEYFGGFFETLILLVILTSIYKAVREPEASMARRYVGSRPLCRDRRSGARQGNDYPPFSSTSLRFYPR